MICKEENFVHGSRFCVVPKPVAVVYLTPGKDFVLLKLMVGS